MAAKLRKPKNHELKSPEDMMPDEIQLRGRAKDLSSMFFGRLTAMYPSGKRNGNYLWRCLCECGTVKDVLAQCLLSGGSLSCGCFQQESRKTHGHSVDPLWPTYSSMLDRCFNKRSKYYVNYGGRGIFVCKKWRYGDGSRDGFECWKADMGPKPRKDMEIDRRDNDKGYYPNNCRWVTKTVNMNNRRSNVRLTFKGKTKSVKSWSKYLGIPESRIWSRRRSGWPDSRILTEPVGVSTRWSKHNVG